MSKSLLVGSVYASGEKQQMEWFELQSRYLAATTRDFDHVVFVNHPDVSAFSDKVQVVGNCTADPARTHCSKLHLQALNGLLD